MSCGHYKDTISAHFLLRVSYLNGIEFRARLTRATKWMFNDKSNRVSENRSLFFSLSLFFSSHFGTGQNARRTSKYYRKKKRIEYRIQVPSTRMPPAILCRYLQNTNWSVWSFVVAVRFDRRALRIWEICFYTRVVSPRNHFRTENTRRTESREKFNHIQSHELQWPVATSHTLISFVKRRRLTRARLEARINRPN